MGSQMWPSNKPSSEKVGWNSDSLTCNILFNIIICNIIILIVTFYSQWNNVKILNL